MDQAAHELVAVLLILPPLVEATDVSHHIELTLSFYILEKSTQVVNTVL